jgi:hypothetical protein
MQNDCYHTYSSDDDKDYYEKSLTKLEQGNTKVYRHGYRRSCDQRNEDSSYKIVLKHVECISADITKRPRVRAQHQVVVMFLKNLPWLPYKKKNNNDKSEPLKKHNAG